MKTFIYPGSFDPLTRGHMDIIWRASSLCDRLIVAVLKNNSKEAFFSPEERVQMAQLCLLPFSNVLVCSFDGLLVDFMQEQKAAAVVRGIRSESDFRYELELSATNRLLYDKYESFLLPARQDYAIISSSIVREVASYGGDISAMVPEQIENIIKERFSPNN